MKLHETKGLARFSKERTVGKRKRVVYAKARCFFCGQVDPPHDWKCPTIENRETDRI